MREGRMGGLHLEVYTILHTTTIREHPHMRGGHLMHHTFSVSLTPLLNKALAHHELERTHTCWF